MAYPTKHEEGRDEGFAKMMQSIMSSLVVGAGESHVIKGSDVSPAAFGFIETDDTKNNFSDNGHMEYVPRPELDAKLEAIEARMDGRIARIEDSVKRIADMAADIKDDYREIRSDNRDIRQSVSNLKTVIITSAIGAVISIVLGLWAINSSLTSNMLSAFQIGQQSSQLSIPPTAAK